MSTKSFAHSAKPAHHTTCKKGCLGFVVKQTINGHHQCIVSEKSKFCVLTLRCIATDPSLLRLRLRLPPQPDKSSRTSATRSAPFCSSWTAKCVALTPRLSNSMRRVTPRCVDRCVHVVAGAARQARASEGARPIHEKSPPSNEPFAQCVLLITPSLCRVSSRHQPYLLRRVMLMLE